MSTGAETVILDVTAVAAFHVWSPAWVDERVQAPAITGVMVLPETVQMVGVVAVMVTGKPEVLVAVMVPVVPKVRVVGAVTVRVCAFKTAAPTVMFLLTFGAGFQLVLPIWLATTVQVPAATPATVFPLTEQVAGVWLPKLTVKPDVAVALSVPLVLAVRVGRVPKVMVWLLIGTVTGKLALAWGAGLMLALPT